MIEDSLEPLDRLSVSLPLGCDPTGCGFNDPRTHKRHLVSLFLYPVFREPVREDFRRRSRESAPSRRLLSGEREAVSTLRRPASQQLFSGSRFFLGFSCPCPPGATSHRVLDRCPLRCDASPRRGCCSSGDRPRKVQCRPGAWPEASSHSRWRMLLLVRAAYKPPRCDPFSQLFAPTSVPRRSIGTATISITTRAALT